MPRDRSGLAATFFAVFGLVIALMKDRDKVNIQDDEQSLKDFDSSI